MRKTEAVNPLRRRGDAWPYLAAALLAAGGSVVALRAIGQDVAAPPAASKVSTAASAGLLSALPPVDGPAADGPPADGPPADGPPVESALPSPGTEDPSPPRIGTPAPSLEARPATPVPSAGRDAAASAPLEAKPALPLVPLEQALQTKGDLTLRNAPMESALFTIREVWRVNIVAGQNIGGTVNCVFREAPLREVLDAILLANGYSYRAVGDSLVVQSLNDLGSANPLFSSATIVIKHGDLQEIVEAAQLLKSSAGQVRLLPSARSVLVLDYDDRVRTIREFIESMDRNAAQLTRAADTSLSSELEVVYFHTQFISADAARMPLMAVLSPLGRIQAMPRENRLIVVDLPENIEMLRRVLVRIDRPRPQVRITALIYDLSLEDVERLGVNWNSAAKGNSLGSDGSANQALELSTTTVLPTPLNDGAFTVRSLTRNFDIEAVVRLMQTANDARLLADPNVTVLDNEQAEWKSVSEIPYQQITQSELGGQIGTTAFKEAGISLRVRPIVAADGTIELIVEPEFSRLAGFTPNDNQPIIDTRKATTTVRVANRQTLVLGGLRQRSDNGEFNGVPFLKDLKYFGPLFRSRDTTVRESELLVFISPEIIGYDDALRPRQYQGLETIDQRLEDIPPGEGQFGPCGPEETGPGVEGGLLTLPPVEEVPAAEPSSADGRGGTSSKSAAAPLRPPYAQRFRERR